MVFFSAIFGIPLGVIAAIYRNSLIDHILRIFTVSGLAIASFWLAILFQLFFAMKLQFTPLQGRIDGWGPEYFTGFFLIDSLIDGDMEVFVSSIQHLLLPVATFNVNPPSTQILIPVINLDSSEARNSAVFAISIGMPFASSG